MTAQSSLAGFRAKDRNYLNSFQCKQLFKSPLTNGTAAAFYLIRCLSSVARADPDFSTSFARDLCREELSPHSRRCFRSLARFCVHFDCFCSSRWWVRRRLGRWLRWRLWRLLHPALLHAPVLSSALLYAPLLPAAGLLPAVLLPAAVLPLVIQFSERA